MELRTVESLCDAVYSGGTPSRKKPEYYEGGTIPWIKTMEIRDGYIYDSEEKITESGLQNSSAKFVPKESVLIAMYGATVGRVGYLKIDSTTNQAACALVVDSEITNPKWLYYSILATRDSLIDKANGAAQQNISVSIVRNHQIKYVPLEEQERIAGILGSLDDKIEANTRLIHTLSDYCVALVDSLKLFEGSRESTLGEIITFSPKVKKPAGEEYQFIDMSSLPTMGPVPETISSKNSWSGAKFENGDTLFARITPCLENGKTAIAMGLGDEPACGSTEFIVMRANTPEQVILPYGIARCDKFRQEAMSHMIGSTGRQRVKWQDLANIPVSVPSKSDMQKIEKSTDIFGYFEALRKENLQLAATRDALIKRLIG